MNKNWHNDMTDIRIVFGRYFNRLLDEAGRVGVSTATLLHYLKRCRASEAELVAWLEDLERRKSIRFLKSTVPVPKEMM